MGTCLMMYVCIHMYCVCVCVCIQYVCVHVCVYVCTVCVFNKTVDQMSSTDDVNIVLGSILNM